MLKATEQAGALPSPEDERPVGELVHELVENGKAYARAEVGFAKAVAVAKAQAFKIPGILLFGALLLLQGAVNVLAVAAFFALEPAVGPVAAGLIAFLIFAGVAGGFAWFAVRKLREEL